MPVKITGPTRADVSLRGDIATEDTFAALVRTLDSVASSLHGFVTVDDLNKIQGTWAGEVDGLLEHVKNAFTDGAAITRINVHSTTVDLLKKKSLTAAAGVDVTAPSDPFAVPLVENPAATEFLANARNRLVAVGDDVWGVARDQLVQGMQAGEGVASLRQRVQDSANFSAQRAEVVARSEVSHAMNQGSIAQVGALGIPMMKEWIAVLDDRTRLEHAEMDGQQVPLDGTFPIGFDPGDDYNCRCTTGFSTPTPSQGGDDLGSTEDSFLENACACDNPVLLASVLVASAFAGYDPEYAKRYREKKKAEKVAKEAGQPPPPPPSPPKYEPPKVESVVKKKVEDVRQQAETLTSPCSCDAGYTPASYQETNDAFSMWASDLPENEQESLSTYISEKFMSINGALRGGEGDLTNVKPWVAKVVRDVDSAIDRSIVKQDMVTYRGMRFPTKLFGKTWKKDNLVGKEFDSHGFNSSSLDPGVAAFYGSDEITEKAGVFMNVIIKRNQHALFVMDRGEPTGIQEYQQEVLLPRGAKFRVVADHGVQEREGWDFRVIDIEVVQP